MDFRAVDADASPRRRWSSSAAKDPATLPECGEDIQKMIKGAKIVSLEAAHISNVEQPKAYTDAVLNFLK